MSVLKNSSAAFWKAPGQSGNINTMNFNKTNRACFFALFQIEWRFYAQKPVKNIFKKRLFTKRIRVIRPFILPSRS